jgi:ribosome biogenesis GTPase / thiamine phosphate phosphatase
MSTQFPSLNQLGWRPLYSQQLSLSDLETSYPARVTSVHRNALATLSERGEDNVTLPHSIGVDSGVSITVGDWVLIENDAARVARLIERHSVIERVAAGTDHRVQPIAANLDTLFIVTSCNDDFNLSRLERYLAVAFDARVEPVIVLTKIDQCIDAGSSVDAYIEQARSIAATTAILAVNAMADDSARSLDLWLQHGQTVAFVGSSGVGKSTLINTLLGISTQATGGIREDDSKGRHTTTSRQMFALSSGAWVIDTPGMRELKVGAVEAGMSQAFEDIETLAQQCRFRDCAHDSDEGCAVAAAIADGCLDSRRLVSYLKLRREAQNAARTVRERRERDRHFGRVHRSAQRLTRRRKGRDQ